MLAFEAVSAPPCSSPRGFCYEIGVVDADGRDERTVSQSWEGYGPDWSPDSTRIAYFGERDGNWDIYAVDADGSDHARLTSTPAFEAAPVWSPDGTSIAFLGGVDTLGVSVMSAEGSEPRFLVPGQGEPSWQSLPGRAPGRSHTTHFHRGGGEARADVAGERALKQR
jgi:Tol biopolymer transport system component